MHPLSIYLPELASKVISGAGNNRYNVQYRQGSRLNCGIDHESESAPTIMITAID
jgi:hypothetical protein